MRIWMSRGRQSKTKQTCAWFWHRSSRARMVKSSRVNGILIFGLGFLLTFGFVFMFLLEAVFAHGLHDRWLQPVGDFHYGVPFAVANTTRVTRFEVPDLLVLPMYVFHLSPLFGGPPFEGPRSGLLPTSFSPLLSSPLPASRSSPSSV